MLFGDAVGAQLRDVEVVAQFAHPIGADNFVIALRCVAVRFHDFGQQRGTDGAVRRVEHAADCGGETMHRAETGVGQREPTAHAREGHVLARGPVVAIIKRAP